MAIGYTAPEDVINAALREAGYPRPIAEIYEGTRASRVAVEVYGTARDFLLQQQDWDFALKQAALAALSGGTGILGFTQIYTYPADALRIRSVCGAIPSPNNDPQPVRWITGSDANGSKAIYTSQASALVIYIAQITDPAKWNAGFTRAFIGILSRIFAFALKDDINLARTRSQLADQGVTEGSDVSDGMSPVVPEQMMRAAAAAAARQ